MGEVSFFFLINKKGDSRSNPYYSSQLEVSQNLDELIVVSLQVSFGKEGTPPAMTFRRSSQ